MYTLNCKGKLLVIESPLVMGILNITPDSFYEGYLDKELPAIVSLAEEMISAGADILDIGGQSTRPGSVRISAEEELDRILPVIQAILKKMPSAIISVDTYYSRVAEAAIENGASIINDISAGNMDSKMIATVASLQIPYICMHMKGSPDTMQNGPRYENVVTEVLDFFIDKIAECKNAGINDVIIDPGFGFGKTIAHNFILLKYLHTFSMLEKPILAGISRKSTVYKTLGTTANEALNGTTVLNTIALLNGASIVRVHDVKEAKEAIKLIRTYNESSNSK
ncbi:dihydropteroate synthase [Ferruginibacter albus]|uniref:dihydropteroate synthase n=1 Tax=Ferruginibacter albus TaxID=2875540 RepID=UPI001CC71E28|nr:dihydropteroate synthase [Ferruginibacter albus]UAY50918.1 dihydropteroate synthase [Ferruginibacter albus]